MATQAPRQTGFTLIEVVVSLAIFATIAALSFLAFDQTQRASRSITQQMVELQALQRTLQTLGSELSHLQPRPVREPGTPTSRAALLADVRNLYVLELTRGGYANPLGVPRATAQRVAYRVDEGELVRTQWPALDNPLSIEPRERVLLENVERFEVRFLVEGRDNWIAEWPPLGGSGGGRPRAVELIIEHEQWGEIRRLIEIRG